MTSTSAGREAESRVANELKRQGYELIAQNWRTRYCEIDLIMKKGGAVYFIEVKYRGSDTWGGGLEYITPRKLKQMRFAAEYWLTVHDWQGDAHLCVVATGDEGMEPIILLE